MYFISKQNDRKQIIVNVHRKTDWKKRLIWGDNRIIIDFFLLFSISYIFQIWEQGTFCNGKENILNKLHILKYVFLLSF